MSERSSSTGMLSDSSNTKKQKALNIAMQNMMVSSKTKEEYNKTKSLGMVNKEMFSTWKSSKPLAKTLRRKNKLDIHIAIIAPVPKIEPIVVVEGSRKKKQLFDPSGNKYPREQLQNVSDSGDIHDMMLGVKESTCSYEQYHTYMNTEFSKVVQTLLKDRKLQIGDVISTQMINPRDRNVRAPTIYHFYHVIDMGEDFVLLFDIMDTIKNPSSFTPTMVLFPLSYTEFVKPKLPQNLNQTPTRMSEFRQSIRVMMEEMNDSDGDDEDEGIDEGMDVNSHEEIILGDIIDILLGIDYIALYELPTSVINLADRKAGTTYACTKDGRIVEIPKNDASLTKRVFTKISLS